MKGTTIGEFMKQYADEFKGKIIIDPSNPIAADENGERAEIFIIDARYSTFIVDKMLDKTRHGAIGLWVDIGTIGYFKDLKITRR